MRIFLALICSLALACVASGAQEEQKPKKPAPKEKQAQTVQQPKKPAPKKKQAQTVQHAVTQPPSYTQKTAGGRSAEAGKPRTVGKATTVGKPTKGKVNEAEAYTAEGSSEKHSHVGKPAGVGKATTAGKRTPAVTQPPSVTQKSAGGDVTEKAQKTKGSQQITAQGGQTTGGGAGIQQTKKAGGSAVQSSTKTFKPRRFNLPSKSKPATSVAPAVTFQQNRRIQGSDQWVGTNYQAFRNYRSEWHDRDWWRHHHSRLTFVFGGWYFWNANYWYPAWGYEPEAYYAYDGPIYGYNDLPPDQVIANVQTALQEQGYYHGEVDGLLGPLTRGAIADYQRANGLIETAAIDQPTLESLGMT